MEAAPKRASNARKQHITKPIANRSQNTAKYRAAKSSPEQQKGYLTFTANQSALNSTTAAQEDPILPIADYTAQKIFTANHKASIKDHSAKTTL